ncbi:hypothetical protein C5Y96_12895 [Blastopirellula marina]|uniref:Uncharacterized protein n=1 Tax=Blastopirellula marina TaxID=124 RepID=A0A2S8FGF7_9BACT|nr:MULTISPECIES: hypothetical protein [Pirellulaceae]PQO31236.1 hypothetical protein C5Y96_12895 [Blastopirellula marina]RCS51630.1 hypothetical protein DTL36_12905 [Bremerella cremea]
MIAAPWYLSSIGIMLVVIGALAGAVFSAGSSRTHIDPRMSDEEIAKRLDRQQSIGFPGFMVYAGLLCLVVGIGWRVLRVFL